MNSQKEIVQFLNKHRIAQVKESDYENDEWINMRSIPSCMTSMIDLMIAHIIDHEVCKHEYGSCYEADQDGFISIPFHGITVDSITRGFFRFLFKIDSPMNLEHDYIPNVHLNYFREDHAKLFENIAFVPGLAGFVLDG